MKNRPHACRYLKILFFALVAPSASVRSEGPVVYDTRAPMASPLTGETLRIRSGWRKVDVAGAMRGDGVIENGRISVVLRRSDGRLVLFYGLGGDLHECAQVAGAIGGQDLSSGFTSIHADPTGRAEAGVTVDATTEGGRTISFRCRVSGDAPIVECQPVAGVTTFSLSYRSGHAILPEIFGDDLILRAGAVERSPLSLPGEHAFLHPTDRGNALLMCSWPPAPKEIPVHAGTVEDGPSFRRSDVPCAGSEKIWISVLAGHRIWHEADAARFTISEYRKLDWTPPFPARYRCDLRKDNAWGLTDSWVRRTTRDKFWMAFLGNGFPPLCMQAKGVFVRLPRFRVGLPFPKNLPQEIRYGGPILIYPFGREQEAGAGRTPDGEWTVLDVLRVTLGDTWAQAMDIGEGILAVEPFPRGFVFAATCGSTATAEKIFSKGKEKAEAATIRRAFDDMNQFVRYNRMRIEEYVAFAASWRKSLVEHKGSPVPNPELDRAVEDLEPLLQYLPDLLDESRDTIKTPDYCKGLTEKVIELIDRRDPDKVSRVKKLGSAMRRIGGRQDDLLSGYRMAVKAFRQRAGQIHAAAGDPSVRELMRNLRGASRLALRISSPYEEFLFLSAERLAEKQ